MCDKRVELQKQTAARAVAELEKRKAEIQQQPQQISLIGVRCRADGENFRC